ncbi:hypothetical protein Hanom_Chr01g00009081 [Helianthus anomalus]
MSKLKIIISCLKYKKRLRTMKGKRSSEKLCDKLLTTKEITLKLWCRSLWNNHPLKVKSISHEHEVAYGTTTF